MLNEHHRSVHQFLAKETFAVRQKFQKGEPVTEQMNVLSAYAFAFYIDLVGSGRSIHFNEQLLQNREVPPTQPEFFQSMVAVQELVELVNDLAGSSNPVASHPSSGSSRCG